jgi:hypothetical protein
MPNVSDIGLPPRYCGVPCTRVPTDASFLIGWGSRGLAAKTLIECGSAWTDGHVSPFVRQLKVESAVPFLPFGPARLRTSGFTAGGCVLSILCDVPR